LKSTGIVRRMDELGRLVLPVELRRTMGLQDGAALEVFTQGDAILLRRYEPLCVFCGHGGNLVPYQGKKVCSDCRTRLSEPSLEEGAPS
jgi:transcriptional pleiotropic regulator of transition state genes